MIKRNEGVWEEMVKENQLQKMNLHIFSVDFLIMTANEFTGSRKIYFLLNGCRSPVTRHKKKIIFLKLGTKCIIQNTGEKYT